jgi:hypothetical protein
MQAGANVPKDRTLHAAVIGAAGTVVAAIVGLLAGNTGVADDFIPGARPQETVRITATATETVDTVSTVTATQDDTGSVSSATVLHSGPITLVKGGGGADLDAPASDGTWGTLDAKTLTDVTYYGDAMGLGIKFLPTQNGDVRRCESSTGYRSYDNISVTALRPGDSYCVLTDKDRFSLITITAIAEDESISLTATTLKRAEEVRG